VYYLIQVPRIHLYLENIKEETNYRIKLPNDSECPISYKLVFITGGGITFPRDVT